MLTSSTLFAMLMISGGIILLVGFALIFVFPERKKASQHALHTSAVKLEQTVHRLYGSLPQATRNAVHEDTRDTASILQAINTMLLQQAQQQELARKEAKKVLEDSRRQQTVEPAQPIPSAEPEEPSATAQEIMRVRDEMLLARPKEGDMRIDADVLDAFYEQLGAILLKEQVTPLEETGERFNIERQRVSSTRATRDPQQDTVVVQSESPGYLFHGRLLRPQDVIIYRFLAS